MLWLGLWQMRVFEDKENESAAARAAPAAGAAARLRRRRRHGRRRLRQAGDASRGATCPTSRLRVVAADGTVRVAHGVRSSPTDGCLPSCAGRAAVGVDRASRSPRRASSTQTGVFLPSEAGSRTTGCRHGAWVRCGCRRWPSSGPSSCCRGSSPCRPPTPRPRGSGAAVVALPTRRRVDPEHRLRAAVVGVRGVRRVHDRPVRACARAGTAASVRWPTRRKNELSQLEPCPQHRPPTRCPAIRAALLRYRIMAYVVGMLLVVLVLVGMPLKYLGDNGIGGHLDRRAPRLAVHGAADHRLRPRTPRPLALGTAARDRAWPARCPSCRSGPSTPPARTSRRRLRAVADSVPEPA